MLQSYEPGVRATGTRYANYHKPGMPYFDDVSMQTIKDVTARTSALVTGSVDFIDRCDLKTLELLKQNPGLEIDVTTGFAHYTALMNVTVPPFDNVDVRLALKWAMRRDDIVKKVALGYGALGNDNPIAPSIKFAINPEPVHRFDPDKVKFHLKRAGLSSLKVDLSTADTAFPGAVDAALLMSSHAAETGLELNVVREPEDSYWANVWMKKPFCMSYWGGRPTCDWMFTTAYADDSNWNDTYWKHPRFNELLLSARAELDESKRAAMYAEMQQIVHGDGGVIVLMFANYVSAHTTAVAHGNLNSNFWADGFRLFERWWFA